MQSNRSANVFFCHDIFVQQPAKILSCTTPQTVIVLYIVTVLVQPAKAYKV